MMELGFGRLKTHLVEEEMREGRLVNASRDELEAECKSLHAQLELMQVQMGDIQMEKRARGMKNMERFIAMWKNKALLSTFNTWSKNVKELLRQKRLLKRTVSRMASSKMVAGFEYWAAYAKVRACEMRRTSQYNQAT